MIMKEKAKNAKTDRKFWTDPMSFPVFWAEAQQVDIRGIRPIRSNPFTAGKEG
jgi:hypothetical protein